MSDSIVVNNNGVNTLKAKKTRSFAYFTFQGNSVETALSPVNTWFQFSNPTGGLVELYDNANEFTASPSQLALTYTGTVPKWFNLSAVTNVFKGAGGGAATRTIELQWKRNGVFVGFSRQSQMNSESNIYTGNGLIYLQPGDVLTPWVRNVENGDSVRIDNASFTLSQEVMYYFE